MAVGRLQSVLSLLRRRVGAAPDAAVSDGQLLQRFLQHQDEAAFTTLMQRHGPMVMGTCLRLLHDDHLAEDVFQATFLVLVRRAASIQKQDSLASWLCRVAHHLSLTARTQAARRQTHESRAIPMTDCESIPDVDRQETRRLLDEEVQGLPAKLHAPVVLCYLEGKTYEEAAQQLAWPLGTVKKRLAQGRDRLRQRLTRRGVVATAVAVEAMLGEHAMAAVPGGVMDRTVAAALQLAAGKTLAAAAVSAPVAALADGMVKTMFIVKVKLAAAVVLMVAALAAGAGLVLVEGKDAEAPLPEETPVAADSKPQAGLDAKGEPLPEGAILRLGTLRFRHKGVVSGVGISADEKHVITTASGTAGVTVWDAATGREVRQLQHKAWFGALSVALRGTIVAATGFEKTVVWDFTTGKILAEFEGHGCSHWGIALSPDGTLLATSGGGWWGGRDGKLRKEDFSIRLYSIPMAKEIAHVPPLTGDVNALAFAHDGKTLASSHRDGVRLWETSTLKERKLLAPGLECIDVLAFSPNGKMLAASTTYNKPATILYDLATNKRQTLTPGTPSLAFSPDSKALLGADAGIQMWETATGKDRGLLGAERSRFSRVAYAASGRSIVVAKGNAVQVLDAATGQDRLPASGHQDGVTQVVVSPDGKMLASVGGEWSVRLWDLEAGRELHTIPGGAFAVHGVAFAPDSKTLAAIWSDSKQARVDLYDARSAKTTRTISIEKGNIHSLQYSPDGKFLATGVHGGGSSKLTLWDLAANKKVYDLDGAATFLFSPDGKAIARLGDRFTRRSNARQQLIVCEAASGKELYKYEDEDGYHRLAIAPDGKVLAAVSGDLKLTHLWDMASGKEIRRLEDPTGSAFGIDFSPDGKYLAASSRGLFVLRIWEVATGKEVRKFAGHDAFIHGVQFTGDGKMLVSWGADQTIRTWDAATGKEIRRHTCPPGVLRAVVLTQDGRRLITACQDSTMLVWDLR